MNVRVAWRVALLWMIPFSFLLWGSNSRATPPGWAKTAWIEPQDSAMAVTSPDEYAWRLFIALNWPAVPGKRDADLTKNFGDPGRTVWESWKLVSGGPDKSDVYRKGGTTPTSWDAPLDPYCDAFARDAFPLQTELFHKKGVQPDFDTGPTSLGTDEVRMNSTTLSFIEANNLYNVEGQEALYASGTRSITFPANSKEIKAQWREISPADASRYHSCSFRGKVYGLTALHILTKDLPNWFWATFEHIDNKKPENQSKTGYGPWLLPSKDRFACKSAPFDCEDYPKEIGLEGTKWQYYRLRGTQTEFVDSFGAPIRLGNSQIETSFQATSSCMTCHAKASIGKRIQSSKGANRLNIFEDVFSARDNVIMSTGPVGIPNPGDFGTDGEVAGEPQFVVTYTQLDFVWSLLRAQRRAP
jgi:hypothetical protein